MKVLVSNLVSFWVLILFSTASACSPNATDENPNPLPSLDFTTQTAKMAIKVDTLHTGFQNPWGITWINNGRMLITEKRGEILIFKDDKYTGEKVTGLPAVYANGQAGLLDITTHPDYAQNGWIYISYAKPISGGGATTIARFKLNGNAVADFQELIVTTPVWNGGTHYGSRIVFDNQNFLYFSNG